MISIFIFSQIIKKKIKEFNFSNLLSINIIK